MKSYFAALIIATLVALPVHAAKTKTPRKAKAKVTKVTKKTVKAPKKIKKRK